MDEMKNSPLAGSSKRFTSTKASIVTTPSHNADLASQHGENEVAKQLELPDDIVDRETSQANAKPKRSTRAKSPKYTTNYDSDIEMSEEDPFQTDDESEFDGDQSDCDDERNLKEKVIF